MSTMILFLLLIPIMLFRCHLYLYLQLKILNLSDASLFRLRTMIVMCHSDYLSFTGMNASVTFHFGCIFNTSPIDLITNCFFPHIIEIITRQLIISLLTWDIIWLHPFQRFFVKSCYANKNWNEKKKNIVSKIIRSVGSRLNWTIKMQISIFFFWSIFTSSI